MTLRVARAIAVGVLAVAVLCTSIVAAAASNDGIRSGRIHAGVNVYGYPIRYDGVVTHVLAPSGGAVAPTSVVTFACNFLTDGPTEPYTVRPECRVEDVNSGTAYPANGFQQVGSRISTDTGVLTLAHQDLRLCMRAVVTPRPGYPDLEGPLACVPIVF